MTRYQLRRVKSAQAHKKALNEETKRRAFACFNTALGLSEAYSETYTFRRVT